MPNLNLRHNLPLYFALVVVTLAIPLTVFVSLTHNADIGSKAYDNGKESNLAFSEDRISLYPQREYSTSIKVNTGTNQVTAVDLRLSFDPNKIEILSISPNATYFHDILTPATIDNQTQTARIVMGSGTNNRISGNNIPVAEIRFKAKKTPGLSSLSLKKSKVSAFNFTDSVLAFSSVLNIEVLEAIKGDIDLNGKVDIFDYNLMIQNFGSTICGNIADIDNNCKVNIFDYNFLIQNFGRIVSITPSPTPVLSTSCRPEIGSPESIFKVFIINNDSAPFYEDNKNQIINDFKTVAPFKDYYSQIAFYNLTIPGLSTISCHNTGGPVGSGFACNDNDTDTFIKNACGLSDVSRFIKIIVSESTYGGSAGEVIALGSYPTDDRDLNLAFSEHTGIHEVAHNLGLADLYFGFFYNNGNPSRFYPISKASTFPNTDKAGCGKWCKSFKPVSEYKSSACQTIKEENGCRTHGRNDDSSCIITGTSLTDTNYECCVWDQNAFDYFGQCAPAYGNENIGVDCATDTGCYFGAVYGNDAWRPIKDNNIMLGNGEKFDTVSENWLRKVLEHCLTNKENLTDEDLVFAQEYKNFISNFPGFKQKIGRCGD